MFLDPAELVTLTGREKPSAQIRELVRQGIAHTVNAAGLPVVTRDAVLARHGLRQEVKGPAVIDFAPLRLPAHRRA